MDDVDRDIREHLERVRRQEEAPPWWAYLIGALVWLAGYLLWPIVPPEWTGWFVGIFLVIAVVYLAIKFIAFSLGIITGATFGDE